MELENNVWIYCDTRKPVEDDKDRCCGFCNLPQTIEGHDGCLKTLKYAMNACCGHGTIGKAYFQFPNGFRLPGIFAIIFIKIISRSSDEYY